MAPVGGRPDLGSSRRHLQPFLSAEIHTLSFAVVFVTIVNEGGLARNGEDDEIELENGSDRGTSCSKHG